MYKSHDGEMRFIFTSYCSDSRCPVRLLLVGLFLVVAFVVAVVALIEKCSFTELRIGDAKRCEKRRERKKSAQFFPLMRIKCHFLY